MSDLDESLPTQGDELHPRRNLKGEAEPLPGELESRLDEVKQEPLAEAGAGPQGPTPNAPPDLEGSRAQPPGAAMPGDDEGPTAEGGGGLETAGGGGR